MKIQTPKNHSKRLQSNADFSKCYSMLDLLASDARVHHSVSREVDFLRRSGWHIVDWIGHRGYVRVALINEKKEWAAVVFNNASVFPLSVEIRHRVAKLELC